MNRKTTKAFAVNVVLCGAAFAWLFSQTPTAQPEPVSADETEVTLGKPGREVGPMHQPENLVVTVEPAAMRVRERLLGAGTGIYEAPAANLKLRRKPVLTWRLHRVYPRGARFERLGRDGDWLNVRHLADGSSGWLLAATLRTAN